MSVHISAQKGEISEKILLPGDPLRAKWVAENWLTDVKQFNAVRNMFGFTGLHKGERISVMGTGMGLPSISIYVTELFNEYDVQKAIRHRHCRWIPGSHQGRRRNFGDDRIDRFKYQSSLYK
jgi:purine-nucleoside phosphorylase